MDDEESLNLKKKQKEGQQKQTDKRINILKETLFIFERPNERERYNHEIKHRVADYLKEGMYKEAVDLRVEAAKNLIKQIPGSRKRQRYWPTTMAGDNYKSAAEIVREHPESFKNPEKLIQNYEHNAARFNKLSKESWKGLTGKVQDSVASAAVSIIGLLGGVFFLSSNLTGNVIGSMSQISSNWVGGVLFIVGLVSALLYFRRK